MAAKTIVEFKARMIGTPFLDGAEDFSIIEHMRATTINGIDSWDNCYSVICQTPNGLSHVLVSKRVSDGTNLCTIWLKENSHKLDRMTLIGKMEGLLDL